MSKAQWDSLVLMSWCICVDMIELNCILNLRRKHLILLLVQSYEFACFVKRYHNTKTIMTV